jgi:hypothetical protein
MEDEKVMKEAHGGMGPFEWKLEGLEDGYRITVRGDAQRLQKRRRVGASVINVLTQADKAGWWLPFPFRLLLRFWSHYGKPSA